MKRNLEASPYFEKRSSKFLRYHPEFKSRVHRMFELLMENIFHFNLKTHNLSGRLNNFYGCSINHKYRIVFMFDDEKVYLYDIGSHDEVY